MTNLRRAYVPGGTFFFALVTAGRVPILITPLGRSLLREVTVACRRQWAFDLEAVVLMPDHTCTRFGGFRRVIPNIPRVVAG